MLPKNGNKVRLMYTLAYLLYFYPRTRMNAGNVIKKRYQNSIVTPKANSKTYKTVKLYVFKFDGPIAGHNANLISQ